MKLSTQLSTRECLRCGRVTGGRQVSVTFEYLCDDCSLLLLDLTSVRYLADLNGWHHRPVSPSQIRNVLETRRRLLRSTRLTCAFGNPYSTEKGCGPCVCCDSVSREIVCSTHGVRHVSERRQD